MAENKIQKLLLGLFGGGGRQKSQPEASFDARPWGARMLAAETAGDSDSLYMSAVKRAICAVLDFMSYELPEDEERFNKERKALETTYSMLIDSCTIYRKAHTPHRELGYARLRMVEKIQAMAQEELQNLRQLPFPLPITGRDTGLWEDALAAARFQGIDLTEQSSGFTFTRGGAHTSDLLIITDAAGRKLFFKEDERLRSSSDRLKAKLNDPAVSGKEREVCALLSAILTDERGDLINDTFSSYAFVNEVSTLTDDMPEEERNAIIARAVGILVKSINDAPGRWTDRRVEALGILRDKGNWSALAALIPEYSKWFAQFGIAGKAGIQEGEMLSTRNVATSRLASILDMSDIVAESRFVSLRDENGVLRRGIVMAEAQGKPVAWIEDELLAAQNKAIAFTPKAIRELTNLQVLDTICGQIDRHLNNRFATYEERGNTVRVTGIEGIDNDMAFGTMRFDDLHSYSSGIGRLPEFKNRRGSCAIAALDKSMVMRVYALCDIFVPYMMLDLLPRQEIEALLDRLHGVQNTMRTSAEEDSGFMLTEADWTAETLRQRFRGRDESYTNITRYDNCNSPDFYQD